MQNDEQAVESRIIPVLLIVAMAALALLASLPSLA